MIGIVARGLGHLKRNVPLNIPCPFFMGRIDNPIEGKILRIVTTKGEYLILFNNHRSSYEEGIETIINDINDKDLIKTIQNLQSLYGGIIIFHKFDYNEKSMLRNYQMFFLMPQNFNEEYTKFCETNKKTFSQLFTNYLSQSSSLCKMMYAYTEGSPNMFLWAMMNVCKSVPLTLVLEMVYWFNNYNQFNGKLKKGTMTAYNETRNILKMREELIALRQEKRIGNVFNMFNTQQKKLLKGTELNQTQKEMISRFETMSKEKQLNFIRKVSTLESIDEIFYQMALLTKVHFDWNRDSFIEFITNIENMNFDVVYDNNNVIILYVKDYDTIKYVTRTTNWCISKNKHYWNNYNNNDHRHKRKQYVLFDFNQKEDSELSIVGFTTENDTEIAFAHSFTNVNLINNNREPFNRIMNDFIVSYKEQYSGSIIDILKSRSIPLNKFMRCLNAPYEWNKKTLMGMLEKSNDEEYDIIKDEDNMLVFSVKSARLVINVVGYEQYSKVLKRIDYNPSDKKHLFICDFSKNSSNRMLWAYNSYCEGSRELIENIYDANGDVYNRSLNMVLYENNLPLDIFKKPIDKFSLLKEVMNEYDIEFLSHLLKKEEYRNFLLEKKMVLKNEIYNLLHMTLFNNFSFSALNLFYENGFNLTDLIGCEKVGALFRTTIDTMMSRSKYMKTVPTENDFKKLMNYQLAENKIIPYGMFFTFQIMWENEKNFNIVKPWYTRIHMFNRDLQKYFMTLFIPFINQIVSKDRAEYIADIIINNDLFDMLEGIELKDIFNKVLLNKLPETHPWKIKIMSNSMATVNT